MKKPISSPRFRSVASIVALASAQLVACGRGDVREWTPADHDQPPTVDNAAPPGGRAAIAPPGRGGATEGSKGEVDGNLVELAWQRTCANCHGVQGRGDGPEGMMVHAADLTRREWQDRVSDAEMKEVIRKGRNRMPAFDLPPAVIDGLVQRIRAARER